MGDGPYIWSARVIDQAGNQGPGDTVNFTIDTTPAEIPVIISPLTGTNFTTGHVIVTGTCETGTTVDLSGNIE